MSITRHGTLTNWGAYEVETDGHDITAVHPFAKDPDPSPIGQSLKAVRRSRIARPSIRESWYRHGPGANPERRGWEPWPMTNSVEPPPMSITSRRSSCPATPWMTPR